jgi:hypothetical protein
MPSVALVVKSARHDACKTRELGDRLAFRSIRQPEIHPLVRIGNAQQSRSPSMEIGRKDRFELIHAVNVESLNASMRNALKFNR